MAELELRIEPTPNPKSLKITVNRTVVESGSKSYSSAADADSPVARELLSIEGITSVFMLNDFITVTQDGSKNWGELVDKLEFAVRAGFAS